MNNEKILSGDEKIITKHLSPDYIFIVQKILRQ